MRSWTYIRMTYFVSSSATITGHMYDRLPPGLHFIRLSFLAGCKGGRRRSWLGSGAFIYTKDETFMLTDCPCTFTILIVVVVHRQGVLWDTRNTECSSARYQQHFCQP